MKRTSATRISATSRHTRKMHSAPDDELKMHLDLLVLSEAQGRKVRAALELLGWSLSAADVGGLVGMPLNAVANLRRGLREAGAEPARAGKTSDSVAATLLKNPAQHAVGSVFIKTLIMGMKVEGKTSLSGAGVEFASALRYTATSQRELLQNERLSARRMLSAAIDYFEGKMHMSTCPCCKSSYLRTKQLVQASARSMPMMGSCPVCTLKASESRVGKKAAVLDLAHAETPSVATPRPAKTLDVA